MERFCTAKEAAVAKIHDTPEFHQAVFYRGTAHRNSHMRVQGSHRAALRSPRVLDVLRFIDDHKLPIHIGQLFLIGTENAIGRHKDIRIDAFDVAIRAMINANL